MKKWLVALLVLLLALASIYVFIPSRLIITEHVDVVANQQAVYRYLSNEKNWAKWLPPGSSIKENNSLSFGYGERNYNVKKILYNAFEIDLRTNSDTNRSLLQPLAYSIDSLKLQWSVEIATGSDPFTKLRRYWLSKNIQDDVRQLLHQLKAHLEIIKNLYGVDIMKEKVTMQLLLSTRNTFDHYPTMNDVYKMVDSLAAYIKSQNVNPEYHPMLNIRADSGRYIAQVALPVPKSLPERNNFSMKWMMKGGNILTGEVTGGDKAINDGIRSMEQYISDHQRTIIAIPFQMLITHRLQQPDSSKWLTRLYFPVI